MVRASSALIMPGLRALLPRPRLPPRLIVQEENDRPNLFFRQEILPCGHRRVPGRPFARQPGSALGDAPEHEALRELGDRSVVLEVQGDRIEPVGVMALTVEMVAVTRDAILIVD